MVLSTHGALLLHADGVSIVEAVIVAGHVMLFLGTARIALTSWQAYRETGDALHRNLAVAFLFLVLGLSLDDFLREMGFVGRIGSEFAELTPGLVAIGLIYYALFLRSP